MTGLLSGGSAGATAARSRLLQNGVGAEVMCPTIDAVSERSCGHG
jgi:hypothetical protein